MNLILQIFVFTGIALVGYSLLGLLFSGDGKAARRGKRPMLAPSGQSGPIQEQKILRIQELMDSLEK